MVVLKPKSNWRIAAMDAPGDVLFPLLHPRVTEWLQDPAHTVVVLLPAYFEIEQLPQADDKVQTVQVTFLPDSVAPEDLPVPRRSLEAVPYGRLILDIDPLAEEVLAWIADPAPQPVPGRHGLAKAGPKGLPREFWEDGLFHLAVPLVFDIGVDEASKTSLFPVVRSASYPPTGGHVLAGRLRKAKLLLSSIDAWEVKDTETGTSLKEAPHFGTKDDEILLRAVKWFHDTPLEQVERMAGVSRRCNCRGTDPLPCEIPPEGKWILSKDEDGPGWKLTTPWEGKPAVTLIHTEGAAVEPLFEHPGRTVKDSDIRSNLRTRAGKIVKTETERLVSMVRTSLGDQARVCRYWARDALFHEGDGYAFDPGRPGRLAKDSEPRRNA